jgi:hypothetical protein
MWSAATPMDNDERNLAQAALSKVANPTQKVWIYRNSVYGYPWFYEVRALLDDAEYRPWFIKFANATGPFHSPPCDDDYSPPKCTDLFHTQMDTPLPRPGGYGQCAPPASNCGTKPCGFYVFNHSSDVVIKGQTFRDWFIDSFILSAVGDSPLVSGFFFDGENARATSSCAGRWWRRRGRLPARSSPHLPAPRAPHTRPCLSPFLHPPALPDFWSLTGNMGDNTPQAISDMGLTPADLTQLTASYEATMAALRVRLLAGGRFSWQMLWTGGAADAVGQTCPSPLVRKATCAADLRALCAAGSPQYVNRTLMYAFGPGGCSHVNPDALPDLENDLANFLLVRGPWAYLGTAWVGCSRNYFYPPALAVDYGVPSGLCAETAPASGVFTRDYSGATVTMDCATWTSTITMKWTSTITMKVPAVAVAAGGGQ